MRLQLLSDLHSEFYRRGTVPLPSPAAPYLILAGDIGNPVHNRPSLEDVLSFAARRFERAVYVAGNHEYFGSTCAAADDSLRELCGQHGVTFLQCNSTEIENMRVLGCTLWSYVTEEAEFLATRRIADYAQIYSGSGGSKISTADSNMLHIEHRTWLSRQIRSMADESPEKQMLVVTHHLPSFQSPMEEYQSHSLSCCFATNLEDICHKPVAAWCAGHSHGARSLLIRNDIWLHCNAYGYPGEDLPARRLEYVFDVS